ncbi:Leucine Rich Repeat domain protein [Penicillium verhagenii]|uniref:Leucine Rich Repeat domain protein n=1 Tax=Penicillium verhagenii TaxID=1562060 RepID=UPI0025453DF8|nr:Leucine Rich Repeat domain protein [Penicillium verhagenii]KAJ5924498.1 Leucine Rich Repeat domain protein [Penicillium verhagenii]
MPRLLVKDLDAYETVIKKAPPPNPSALVIEQRQKINTAGDPFTSLPFEICLEILRELPVPDFKTSALLLALWDSFCSKTRSGKLGQTGTMCIVPAKKMTRQRDKLQVPGFVAFM